MNGFRWRLWKFAPRGTGPIESDVHRPCRASVPPPARRLRVLAWSALFMLLLALGLPGCNIIGYMADVAGGDLQNKTIDVAAAYDGLEGQTTAVLVAADQRTLHAHPEAVRDIGRRIGAQLAFHLEDVRIVHPDEIAAFVKKHPYWMSLPYDELTRKLRVDRLILVDLIHLQMHEPGNRHEVKGYISANVGVVEADGQDPNNFAYYSQVTASYPQNKGVPVLESKLDEVRFATLSLFAEKVAFKFYDHQETVPR